MRRLRFDEGAQTSSGEEGVKVEVGRDIEVFAIVRSLDLIDEICEAVVDIQVNHPLVTALLGRDRGAVGYVEVEHVSSSTLLLMVIRVIGFLVGFDVADDVLDLGETELQNFLIGTEAEDYHPAVKQSGWILHGLLHDFFEPLPSAGGMFLGEWRQFLDD